MTKIMTTVYMHTCSLLTINSDTGENCTSVDEKVPLTTYIQSLARLIAMCWQSVNLVIESGRSGIGGVAGPISCSAHLFPSGCCV